MHDLITSTTGEIQLKLLNRAITRRDQQIAALEAQLAGLRRKQQSRFRELKATEERARKERSELDAKNAAVTTET